MGEDYNHPTDNIDYLLDKIIEVIPAPKQVMILPSFLSDKYGILLVFTF